MKIKNILLVGLLMALAISGCNCVEVEGNEVAVIETMNGPQRKTLGPGLHLLTGLRNEDFKYPINDQTFIMGPVGRRGKDINNKQAINRLVDEEELVVKSSDGQKVWISLTLRYALDRSQIITTCKIGDGLCGIHVEARDTYESTWIRPEVVRITKDLATEYTAKQIYAKKRPELNKRIEEQLSKNKDLGGKGILVKTFVLDQVRLDKLYEKEIADTVLQDQRRIRASKEGLAAKEEAKTAKAKAQSEVERRRAKANASKIERISAAEAKRFENDQAVEAARFSQEQDAIGLLAQGQAEAKVAKLKKNANYDGVAGERHMQVELAKYRSESAKGLFPKAVNIGDLTVRQVLKQFTK